MGPGCVTTLDLFAEAVLLFGQNPISQTGRLLVYTRSC